MNTQRTVRRFSAGAAGLSKLMEPTDGVMAVASAEIPPEDERGGDVIRLSGMEVPPEVPLLASHSHAGPAGEPTVIGRCNRFARGTIDWKGKPVPALLAGWDWADTQLAKQYRELWEGGYLDSVSVGAIVNDASPLDPKDPWGGWEIKKSELIELSIVAVPANPAARAYLKEAGILDDHEDIMRSLDLLGKQCGESNQAIHLIAKRLDDFEAALSVIAEGLAKQRHAPNTSPSPAVVNELRAILSRIP